MINPEDRQFTIGQVTSLFFDQTTDWMRWKIRDGLLTRPDETEIGSRRHNGKLGGGDRVFSLDDVAEIIKVFRAEGILDTESARAARRRVEVFRTPVETYTRSRPTDGPGSARKAT